MRTCVLNRLTHRTDYLRLANSPYKWASRGLVLQVAPTPVFQNGIGASVCLEDDKTSHSLATMPANPAALSPAQLAALADDVWHIRLGFTASKKVGNAVKRNRARRRLKEIARLHMPRLAKPGYDYVLIARPVAVGCPYDHLVQDLDYALMRLGAHIHRAPKQPFTPRPAPPPRRKR